VSNTSWFSVVHVPKFLSCAPLPAARRDCSLICLRVWNNRSGIGFVSWFPPRIPLSPDQIILHLLCCLLHVAAGIGHLGGMFVGRQRVVIFPQAMIGNSEVVPGPGRCLPHPCGNFQ